MALQSSKNWYVAFGKNGWAGKRICATFIAQCIHSLPSNWYLPSSARSHTILANIWYRCNWRHTEFRCWKLQFLRATATFPFQDWRGGHSAGNWFIQRFQFNGVHTACIRANCHFRSSLIASNSQTFFITRASDDRQVLNRVSHEFLANSIGNRTKFQLRHIAIKCIEKLKKLNSIHLVVVHRGTYFLLSCNPAIICNTEKTDVRKEG